MNKIGFTVSNTLMLVAVFFTALSFLIDIGLFGMNSIFYNAGVYHYWILQMFTSQFIHGSILHIASNTIFILYFGNVLERIIGKNMMLLFFVTCSVFLGIMLTFLTNANTIGISGFALAVITCYTLILYSKGNPEYTGGITAVVINIFIGFTPGISFLGHFGGMIFGIIFWYIVLKK